ncbi:MAG TPA: selenide, water dikinase SelD [Actinomycetota bacterium]|nr:selenide, water dikinase SelD [Actinomycetota bacterium]
MLAERRLTAFSHGAGCGCKLGPSELGSLLSTLDLPAPTAEVLVGTDTGDDAAVVRLPGGQALIATLDFFTPIVDDPYDWGRIAATNALSDVYAMGGRPLLALNIVNWPADDLPLEMLGRVLQGGVDVAAAAGVSVLGGHSITDPEPKYGMVVIGLADPERIVRNSAARAGDRLFLTKPIGLGIVSTAVKRGVAATDLVARAVDLMTTLNDRAADAMLEAGAVAATDVTGFGLLGHLHRMLAASGVAARVDASAVPVMDGVLALARDGVVPGGTGRNHAFVDPHVDWGTLERAEQIVLADAQTSGGLLVATAHGERLSAAFRAREVAFVRVGEVVDGPAGRIAVTGRLGAG